MSNLRTTALAVRIMIQPTTDWNIEAAEVQPMLVVGEVSIRNTFTSSVATQEVSGWLAPWET